jgi:hypothetical protein
VYASSEDIDLLLLETLDRETRKFGTRIIRKPDGTQLRPPPRRR